MIMRKMISLLISLVFGLFSCNKNCNDCGSISSATYFIKNGSVENLEIFFYGDSSTNFSTDIIKIPPNDRAEFLYVSTGSPIQSTLKFKYYLCDSIRLYYSNTFKSRYDNLEDCDIINNPMCTSNYTLTKLDEVKNGKNKGDKYSEYELILK